MSSNEWNRLFYSLFTVRIVYSVVYYRLINTTKLLSTYVQFLLQRRPV